MRFHAIRERSSLISRSKDAAAVALMLQEHGFALLPIAGRARSCSPGITSTLHQAQMLLQCLQPSLVHHTERHRAR